METNNRKELKKLTDITLTLACDYFQKVKEISKLIDKVIIENKNNSGDELVLIQHDLNKFRVELELLEKDASEENKERREISAYAYIFQNFTGSC